MSSLKLKHSGGNSVSLNPPSSAPTSSDVAFKLPNADGSANQVIKTDGSGNLAFVTPTSSWVHAAETALNGNTVLIENGVPDGASHIRYLLRYVSVSSSSTPFVQIELNNNGTLKNSNFISCSTRTRGASSNIDGDSDKTDGMNLWYSYDAPGNTLFGVLNIYRIGTNGSDGTNYYMDFSGLGNSSSSGYDGTFSSQAYFELGTGSTDYVSGIRLSTGSGSSTFDNGYVQQSYLLS